MFHYNLVRVQSELIAPAEKLSVMLRQGKREWMGHITETILINAYEPKLRIFLY
jgi:hypothetical protein